MVMASVENFLETLQKKFYLQNITIRRNFNSILRDLIVLFELHHKFFKKSQYTYRAKSS